MHLAESLAYPPNSVREWKHIKHWVKETRLVQKNLRYSSKMIRLYQKRQTVKNVQIAKIRYNVYDYIKAEEFDIRINDKKSCERNV